MLIRMRYPVRGMREARTFRKEHGVPDFGENGQGGSELSFGRVPLRRDQPLQRSAALARGFIALHTRHASLGEVQNRFLRPDQSGGVSPQVRLMTDQRDRF